MISSRASSPSAAAPVQNLEELTALRIFAACAVVFLHVYPFTPAFQDLSSPFLLKGYFGVDVFFVLSGFILSHVYRRPFMEGAFSYTSFLINRVARIYPLHLALLLAFLVMYLVASRAGITAGEGMVWSHFVPHLLMLHAWGLTDRHSWNFPSWSISAEFFAYLMFPLFMQLSRLRPAPLLALTLAAFAAAFLALQSQGIRLTAMMYDFGIVRIAFEFAIGVAVYRAYETWTVRAALVRPLAVLTAVLLGVAIAFDVSDLWLVPLSAVLIFLLAESASNPKPWILRNPVLVYLGEISYSVYMVHYLVSLVYIWLMSHLLGTAETIPMAAWLGMWVLIFAVSAGTYHLVELPARQAIRNFAKHRREVKPARG